MSASLAWSVWRQFPSLNFVRLKTMAKLRFWNKCVLSATSPCRSWKSVVIARKFRFVWACHMGLALLISHILHSELQIVWHELFWHWSFLFDFFCLNILNAMWDALSVDINCIFLRLLLWQRGFPNVWHTMQIFCEVWKLVSFHQNVDACQLLTFVLFACVCFPIHPRHCHQTPRNVFLCLARNFITSNCSKSVNNIAVISSWWNLSILWQSLQGRWISGKTLKLQLFGSRTDFQLCDDDVGLILPELRTNDSKVLCFGCSFHWLISCLHVQIAFDSSLLCCCPVNVRTIFVIDPRIVCPSTQFHCRSQCPKPPVGSQTNLGHCAALWGIKTAGFVTMLLALFSCQNTQQFQKMRVLLAFLGSLKTSSALLSKSRSWCKPQVKQCTRFKWPISSCLESRFSLCGTSSSDFATLQPKILLFVLEWEPNTRPVWCDHVCF